MSTPVTAAFPATAVKRCEEIFALYDEDGSGAFDKDEFKVLWKVLHFASGRKITDEEIDRIFQRFDTDRDGLLNMNEFIQVI